MEEREEFPRDPFLIDFLSGSHLRSEGGEVGAPRASPDHFLIDFLLGSHLRSEGGEGGAPQAPQTISLLISY